MILYRKYKFAIFGVAVLCAAVSSHALTLGRARGAVQLGQSLQLTVPIRAEPEEGASALCFEADVFYGDTQQDASRVAVSSDFSPTSQSGNVHVTVNVRVDEPVVTVYLRAGCQNKTTRRYVVLADMASEIAPPAVVPPQKVVRELPRPVAQAATPQVVPVAPDNGSTPAKPPKRAVTVRPVRAPSAVVPVQPVAPLPAKRGARLKLAPLDLTVDRDPTLKSSNELHWSETEDLQKRAEAVALWRSLNATPQDILGADSRRLAMEADLKGLQAITTKNHQALQELTNHLERAESERYSNPLVYGLLAVLLACSAAVVYAWMRMRRMGQAASPWWRDEAVHGTPEWAEEGHTGLFVHAEDVRAVQAPSHVPQDSGTDQSRAALTEVDIDLHMDDPHGPTPARATRSPAKGASPVTAPSVPSRAAGHVDFAHSMTASLRALNTQEMLDVRQQAEFFMTLGQHEEAIGMLKESIASSADSNPLVYLDLLRVLHTLGRKVEYDQYRADFNALFSGRVPTYTEFNNGRLGLEGYPEVCQKIGTLWPSDDVVAYIESCLVRTPEEDPAWGFELEAFRDLLMLHGVAQRIASISDSGLAPFSTTRTEAVDSNPSLTAHLVVDSGLHDKTLPMAPVVQSVDGLSVDLDLSEPPGNLIDFDPADLLPFKPGTPRNPR